MLWIQFIICAAAIITSGYKMTVFADEISEKTGLSSGLMGTLILAVITSCPELVTTLSSISVVDAPDLALGDLVGANAFNIFAIALIGILCGKGSILRGQTKVSIFTASLSVFMLIVVIVSIRWNGIAEIFDISLGSIAIGALYIGGVVLIYKKEGRGAPRARERIKPSLKAKFSIAASIIIASGVWLAKIGKDISVVYGLNEMYVGVLLVAFATTMPEFVVSLTALKQNSVSMAVGNLLGSNIFNIFIIIILDAFLRRGNFFTYVSDMNILVGFFTVALTAIALGAMLRRGGEGRAFKFFSWDSLIIIAVFLAGHILLFNLTRGV